MAHIDDVPVGQEEAHGRSGRHKNKRRPSSKLHSDLAYLVNYIAERVEQRNGIPEQITLMTVDAMWNLVADEFGDGAGNAQKKWTTVVREVRVKHKAAVARANSGITRRQAQ